MDSDPLTQCFMNGAAQSIIQVGFAAKDQGKTVYGIIPVIHQHLDVVQNAGGEILRFVNRQEEWLTLLFIEIPDLLLDRLEHSWFPTFVTDAEGGAELAVKFHDTDGGQADVLHVVQIWVQTFGETAQAERFSHAGTGGEHTDPPCIL